MTTSYSNQMRILIEEIEAEWHYVENGMLYGRTEHLEKPNLHIYPGRNGKSTSVQETWNLALSENPDFLFLYEDPQNILKYATNVSRIPYSAVCWFPWDSDTWHDTLSYMETACKNVEYIPIPNCISYISFSKEYLQYRV